MRLILSLFLLLTLAATPAMAQMPPLETVAREAIIMDAETGQVLFEKNADEQMPTSSMSKTMTIYLVFDALKSGKLSLDQTLPVSEKAWRMQGSKMFVALNSTVSVEDLIKGVVIQSGNDATIVLAEGLAGSEQAFADMMNRKAAELGMTNSHFMNASGWPDPNHYSTARDLATLSKALIANYPELYKYYSQIDFTYNGIKQGNRNPLLYKNIGADGVKTGHTEIAGYGLIGSAVRDGRRVIMVLNGMASMDERAQESTRLMVWALNNFKLAKLFEKGDNVTDAPVVMGMEKSVPLVVDQAFQVTLPRLSQEKIKTQAVFKGPLEAPVKAGQQVGVVRVSAPGIEPAEIPLLAGKDVPRLGFFPAQMEKAKRLIFGDAPPMKYKEVKSAAEPVPAGESK